MPNARKNIILISVASVTLIVLLGGVLFAAFNSTRPLGNNVQLPKTGNSVDRSVEGGQTNQTFSLTQPSDQKEGNETKGSNAMTTLPSENGTNQEKFQLNSMVKAVQNPRDVADGVNIRNEACGSTVLLTARWDDYGTVKSRPLEKECQGESLEWVEILWENGTIGWSITDNLESVNEKPSYNSVELTGDCDWGVYFYNEATRDNPICNIVDSQTKEILHSFKPDVLYGVYQVGEKYTGKQYVYAVGGDAFVVWMVVNEYVFSNGEFNEIGTYTVEGLPVSKTDSEGYAACSPGTYQLDCFDTTGLSPQQIEKLKVDYQKSNQQYAEFKKSYELYTGIKLQSN